MNEYAYKLKLMSMASAGSYGVNYEYDDGSLLTVNASRDENYHYLNGSVGSLVPMNIPRLWPFGMIAIWHEADLC